MCYTKEQIGRFSSHLAQAFDEPVASLAAEALIAATSCLLQFDAAICVVNRRHASPIYICDTFRGDEAKRAVQRYCRGTYLINPAYNAFLAGLKPGLYRMRDLAPDNWTRVRNVSGFEVTPEASEEIGYLTLGWPARCEELVLVTELPSGMMGDISFSRSVAGGGFTEKAIRSFEVFVPLVAVALSHLWNAGQGTLAREQPPSVRLEDFGRDCLSPREAQVVQMILKGHSSYSISQHLGISLTTVKTHRQNAYAKLGIATQQELFSAFLKTLPL